MIRQLIERGREGGNKKTGSVTARDSRGAAASSISSLSLSLFPTPGSSQKERERYEAPGYRERNGLIKEVPVTVLPRVDLFLPSKNNLAPHLPTNETTATFFFFFYSHLISTGTDCLLVFHSFSFFLILLLILPFFFSFSL